MKKTVLTFGVIGGVVISVLTLGAIPLATRIGFDKSEFVRPHDHGAVVFDGVLWHSLVSRESL